MRLAHKVLIEITQTKDQPSPTMAVHARRKREERREPLLELFYGP